MKLAFVLLASGALLPAQQKVKSLRITVLSTMVAESVGIGEWGFAALVEADGRRILFDTGSLPDTVLKNVRQMKIDLSDVTDVVLSHNHRDHTGGLLTLREAFAQANPKALSVAHVGEGIFHPRRQGEEWSSHMLRVKPLFEKSGGAFAVYKEMRELFPGVWLTGPVPRKHPERNFGAGGRLRLPDGAEADDNVPEDHSLVFDTAKGLVLLSGCGHAGIINTLEHARSKLGRQPVYAAAGGFHVFAASEDTLAWTGGKLRDFGLAHFLGAHCTGIEATFQTRRAAGLSRRTCVVGSVGARFSLDHGLEPGALAK